MPDIREITVEKETTLTVKVDVDAYFTEFASEWLEFLEGDTPTQEDREEFIRETVRELASEDSLHLGAIEWHEDDFGSTEITISKASNQESHPE